MKDNIKANGVVKMWVTDAITGKLIGFHEDHNLVVGGGRVNVARLIGGNIAGKPVTKISVGTGSTPPALDDTTITNAFTKDLDAVTYPTINQVQFSFSLGSTEANGLDITELGLVTSGSQLFARKTRTPIAKTSAVIITGIWIITIN